MSKKINLLITIIILSIIIYLTGPIKNYNSANINVSINEYDQTQLPRPDNHSVLCVIFTSRSSFYQRAEAVWDTWAKYCNKSVFATNYQSLLINQTSEETNLLKKLPFLNVPINESYEEMALKAILAVKLIYEVHFENFDWFLIVDDDTFIFINNLYKFIRARSSNKPKTYGYNFKKNIHSGYHSDGAGILITRESLSRIYKSIRNHKCDFKKGYSDIALGECAKLSGVKMGKSTDKLGLERFHPLGPQDHFQNNIPEWLFKYASNKVNYGEKCCSRETISFNYVSPAEMRFIKMLSGFFKD